MSKTALKHAAQDEIMAAIVGAYYRVGDDTTLTDDERDTLLQEIDRQHKRIEKLFGFEPGSCGRG